jgi:hypothetical protein
MYMRASQNAKLCVLHAMVVKLVNENLWIGSRFLIPVTTEVSGNTLPCSSFHAYTSLLLTSFRIRALIRLPPLLICNQHVHQFIAVLIFRSKPTVLLFQYLCPSSLNRSWPPQAHMTCTWMRKVIYSKLPLVASTRAIPIYTTSHFFVRLPSSLPHLNHTVWQETGYDTVDTCGRILSLRTWIRRKFVDLRSCWN